MAALSSIALGRPDASEDTSKMKMRAVDGRKEKRAARYKAKQGWDGECTRTAGRAGQVLHSQPQPVRA